MVALVGGKAANLGEMLRPPLGLPVPPGFVVTTATCREFLAGGWPDGLDEELREHMAGVDRRSSGASATRLTRCWSASARGGGLDAGDDGHDPQPRPDRYATTVEMAAATGDGAFASACRERLGTMFREIVGVEIVPDDPWAQLRLAIEAVFGPGTATGRVPIGAARASRTTSGPP